MEVPDISGNSELFEDVDNVEFICPFCNTVVEIFNYDLRLSVDLHSETEAHQVAFKLYGKDELRQSCESVNFVPPIDSGASSLPKNKNYSTSDSSKESCRDMLCSDSITRNIVRDGSILSSQALGKSQTSSKSTRVGEHLNRIFDSMIPKIIVKNQNYLNVKDERFFMCILCNAYLEIKRNPQITELSFTRHLDTNKHKARVGMYKRNGNDEHKQQLRALLISQLKTPSINSKYLTTVFGSDLPEIINKNKKFLSQYKNGCGCTLCGVYMEVPSVAENAIYNFSQHLNSYGHRENLKKAKNIPPRAVKSPGRVYFRDNKSVSNSFPKSTYLATDKNKDVSLPVKYKSLTFSTKTQNSSNPFNVSVEYLIDIFGPVLPEIVNKNINFLSRYRNGCLCTLCGICMEIPAISKNAIYNFSQHLQGRKHNEKVKDIISKKMTPPYRILYDYESILLTENEKNGSSLCAESEQNSSNVISESFSYVLSTDEKNSTFALSTENVNHGFPLSPDHEKCVSNLSTEIYSSALLTDRNNYTFAKPTEIYPTTLSSDSFSSALSTDGNNYTFAKPTEIYSTVLSSDSFSSALSTDGNNYTFAKPTEIYSTVLSSDSCSTLSTDGNNYTFAKPTEIYSTVLSSDSCSSTLSTDGNNYTFAKPTEIYSTVLSSDSFSSALSTDGNNYTFAKPTALSSNSSSTLSTDGNNYTFAKPTEIYSTVLSSDSFSSALSTDGNNYTFAKPTALSSNSSSTLSTDGNNYTFAKPTEIYSTVLSSDSFSSALSTDGNNYTFAVPTALSSNSSSALSTDGNNYTFAKSTEIYSTVLSSDSCSSPLSTDGNNFTFSVPNEMYSSSALSTKRGYYSPTLQTDSEIKSDSATESKYHECSLPSESEIPLIDLEHESYPHPLTSYTRFSPFKTVSSTTGLQNYLQLNDGHTSDVVYHQIGFNLCGGNNISHGEEIYSSWETTNCVASTDFGVLGIPIENHLTNDSSKVSYRDILCNNSFKGNVRDSENKSTVQITTLPKSQTTTKETQVDIAYEFLKKIFNSNVPRIIVKNQNYLTMKNENVFLCTLCNAQLQITSNAATTKLSFSQHLESSRHKTKVWVTKKRNDKCKEQLRAVLISQLQSDTIENKSLTTVFGPDLPEIINKNKKFLTQYKNGYACILCGAYMAIINNAIHNFSQHLKSYEHRKKVGGYKPSTKSSKTPWETRLSWS